MAIILNIDIILNRKSGVIFINHHKYTKYIITSLDISYDSKQIHIYRHN